MGRRFWRGEFEMYGYWIECIASALAHTMVLLIMYETLKLATYDHAKFQSTLSGTRRLMSIPPRLH